MPQIQKPNKNVTIIWNGKEVVFDLNKGLNARLRLAAQLTRDRVVKNISRPVTKFKGADGKTRVDPKSRSKPGEFPKADTTRLMKDIFFEIKKISKTKNTAVIGTTLDYGLILETRMNRSFLKRTLIEMKGTIAKLIGAGHGGGKAQILPGQE